MFRKGAKGLPLLGSVPWSKLIKNEHASVVFVTGVSTITSLIFAYYYAPGSFRRDYFRHFTNVVIPIVEENESLNLLFSDHHQSPVLHIWQIVHVLVFDWPLQANAFLGITLYAAIAVILSFCALRGFDQRGGDERFACCTAISIAILVSSMTSASGVAWPLIYIQSIFHFLGVIWIVSVALFCMTPTSLRLNVAVVFSLVLTVAAHGSFGVMYFLAGASTLLIAYFRLREPRILFVALACLTFVILWRLVFLPSFAPFDSYQADAKVAFEALLSKVDEAPLMLAAFGKGVLRGVFGNSIFDEPPSGGWRFIQVPFFFVLAVVYAPLMAWSLYANRLVRVAGMLMLVAVLLAVAAVLFRFTAEFPYHVDAPRYFLLYKLAAAAFLWAFCDFWYYEGARRLSFDDKTRYGRVALSVLAAVVVTQIYVNVEIFESRKELKKSKEDLELALFMFGSDSSNTFKLRHLVGVLVREVNYRRSLNWLAANKLNIFSQDYPATGKLKQHKLAKEIFTLNRGRETEILAHEGVSTCVEHPSADTKLAWKVVVESSDRVQSMTYRRVSSTGTSEVEFLLLKGVQSHYGVAPSNTRGSICVSGRVKIKAAAVVFENAI